MTCAAYPLRMPDDMRERVKRRAAASHRSMNGELLYLIEIGELASITELRIGSDLPESLTLRPPTGALSDNPLAVQVGGQHYVKLKIQPVEFALANRLDPCAFSILKYVSRHHRKAGAQDIDKAIHFLALRRTLVVHQPTSEWPVSMHEYVMANQLGPLESSALLALAEVVSTGTQATYEAAHLALTELRAAYTPTLESKP